jgi:hypothetical protein
VVLIGKLTDFATLSGVKTVRGPSVWIPDEEGSFQVKAVALTSAGATLSECTQTITIGHNHPPTNLTFKGPGTYTGSYPATFSTPQPLTFNTTWTDQDPGDEVTRVEFYEIISGGAEILVGTDRDGPVFGDVIEDIRGETQLFPNQLLKGTHEIIAKAYDTRGAVGQTASSFSVTVTGGNARPTLAFAPTDYTFEIPLYTNFSYTYPINFTASDPELGGAITMILALDLTNDSFGGGPEGGVDHPPIGTTFGLRAEPDEVFGTYLLKVQAQDNFGTNPFDHALSYARYLKVRVQESAPSYDTGPVLAAAIADLTNGTVLPVGVGTFSDAIFTGIEGPDGANGRFSNPNLSSPNLDMTSGVLLSTGKFASWDDGNPTSTKSYDYGTPGDTVLEDRITHSRTHDAAILEFDIDCINSQLECEVQFASEEYKDLFNPGGYHDAINITVDGVPISLVPDGGASIRASSIHPTIPASLILDQQPLEDLPSLREYLFLNGAPPTVEYDGLTVRLRLHAFVTPGVHHVRFSIADTQYPYLGHQGYGLVDSALFIKAGSLRTVNPAQ